jgi:hypothetical protein
MYFSFWLYSLAGLDPYQSLLINLVIMALIGYITFKVIMERVLDSDHSIQCY